METIKGLRCHINPLPFTNTYCLTYYVPKTKKYKHGSANQMNTLVKVEEMHLM